MKIGKLDSQLLEKVIFNNIKLHRKEVMVRPGIGEDCAVVDFGEYALIMSTDPITGAASEVGRLAVHINCNDIASNGVEPLGLMMTILAPEETTEEEIDEIMKQASTEAAKLNVEIIGGHTEITGAVNRIVISATAIGRQLKTDIVKTSGAKVGDKIIMTKTAGLEGTGIIAHDLEEKLSLIFSREMIESAKKMVDKISVVKEGIIAGKIGASSMHDVTEGGILGAVWEICKASKVGCNIYLDRIPIAEETKKICDFFDIDPLKLISSGTMLITITGDKKDQLIKNLNESGIDASVIGEITQEGRYIVRHDEQTEIQPPESDELYKVI
ncbi:hydrogenase expression/formation protein HypE [Paramaledivibacter caminithermalis DSM 15212]|uniref:Hydrogenase expression/formation protein HypE n=1 Tax=Paramaledivibacter caminithermalis (strain DSM 15212 / CIP 107654 / DViRD3) TaxID=1121301 RepID=A0A1M6NUL3_PARC5|nr:AIR synthase family protein [Paramaledivibacter caminithermalis]SHJ99312.1 hydrogenase expression/formation protein HypE [Paramaledivibacter caminithermalis DSM 15212]